MLRPLERLSRPSIGNAVLFLASDQSSFMTGARPSSTAVASRSDGELRARGHSGLTVRHAV